MYDHSMSWSVECMPAYLSAYQHLFISILIDYSHERVLTLLNSELADTLGNLLLRVTSPRLHPTGKAPVFVPDILAAKAR